MLRHAWWILLSGASAAASAIASPAKSLAADQSVDLRAAEAAEMQALVSWVSVGVSAIGLALLLWTLMETRRTAKAAIASVTAAEEAAEIQRDAVQRQLRPYVGFAEFNDDEVTEQLANDRLRVQMKNFGQTPATNTRFRWSFEFRELPVHTAPVRMDDDFQSLGKLSPADWRYAQLRFQIDEEDKKRLDRGRCLMLIRCQVIYELPNGDTDLDDITLYVDRHNHAEPRLFHISEHAWAILSVKSSLP